MLGLGAQISKINYGLTLSVPTPSIILLEENWNSGSIDAGKWTIDNDLGWFSIANYRLQNQRLDSSTQTQWTDSIISIASATSGVATVQCNQSWSTGGSINKQNTFALYVDNNNYIRIASRIGDADNYYIQIVQGGSSVYALQTSIANGKDVKIAYDITSKDIEFYYWNAAWTQMGTTQNYDIGSTCKVAFTMFSNSSVNGAVFGYWDNIFLCNANYATQYPS